MNSFKDVFSSENNSNGTVKIKNKFSGQCLTTSNLGDVYLNSNDVKLIGDINSFTLPTLKIANGVSRIDGECLPAYLADDFVLVS